MSKPYVRPSAVGSIPGGLVRTRYFDGMLLSQADLDNDQRYWLSKRRLTNRALGQGVVWGLRVELDEQSQALLLHEGYAIDCCGNDLVVACAARVPGRELISDPALEPLLALAAEQLASDNKPHVTADGEFRYDYPCGGEDREGRGHIRAALMLEYLECPSEARPVIRDGCGSGRADGCEYGRVIEASRLVLRPMPAREPGPVEQMLEQLARLQEQAPELFPGLGISPEAGAPPMTLVVRVLQDDKLLAERELSLQALNNGAWVARANFSLSLPPFVWISEEESIPLEESDSELRLAFELRPAAGWLFTEGVVEREGEGEDGSSLITAIEPAYALALGWRWTTPLDGSGRFGFTTQLRDWILAPLFHNGPRSAGTNSEITTKGRLIFQPGRVTAVFSVVWGINGNSLATLEPVVVPPEKCLDKLGLAGAGERLSLTLLAGLAAWLWDELRFDPDHAKQPPELSGPRTLAVWIYTIAWRTLFGAHAASPEASEDQRAQLGKLLHELLRLWCDGMIYRGPRCGCDHGVVLGSVEIDPRGRLSNLDIWDGRRHVITGPLINHWLGQFGVEPIDVIAGRIASAICCVAGDCVPKFWDLWALLPGDLAQLEGSGDQVKISKLAFAEQGVLLSDGCYLGFGPTTDVVERLAALGVTVVEREVVGRLRFFALMLDGLRGSKGGASSRYALYTLDGDDGVTAQLLVARPEPARVGKPGETPVPIGEGPDVGVVPKPHAEHMLEYVEEHTRSVRPAARGLVGDVAVELSRGYSLDLYGDSPVEPELNGYAKDVELARKLGYQTVAQLLGPGFEAVSKQALAQEPSAEQLVGLERAYARSEHLVARLVALVGQLIPKVPQPFSPELLSKPEFAKSLAKAIAVSAGEGGVLGIDLGPAGPADRIYPFKPLTRAQVEAAITRALARPR